MDFKALATAAFLSLGGITIAPMAQARPVVAVQSRCSFNGVTEACVVREGTDYIDVTYTSDGKQVTYLKPNGTTHGQAEVIDGNRTYRARHSTDHRQAYFETVNGTTVIGLTGYHR